MTRHYFKKAIASPARVRRRRDAHKGVFVAVTKREGLRTRSRVVGSAWAAQQVGRSKGWATLVARGKRHRWTSEEARQAAKESWRKRHFADKGSGRPAKNRQPIDRAALRAYYARNPTLGIQYFHGYSDIRGGWMSFGGQHPARMISERAALIRLGHLPSYHKRKTFTPEDTGRVVLRRPRRKK